MPLVTVITPTYQHANFIGPCIESVLAQTHQNWEQIIIDDGSTDGTAEKIAEYHDERINYIHQPNQGPFALARTYNRALGQAKGELIAILEGDDLWPPQKLAELVPAFRAPEIAVAYGQVADLDASGAEQKRMSGTARLRHSLPTSVLCNDPIGSATLYMLNAKSASLVMPSTAVIRRRLLEEIGGFQCIPDLPLTDYPTFLELSLRGKFFYVPKTMGYRRQHLNSITLNHAECVYENTFRFALNYIERHKDELALKAPQKEEIQRSWDECRLTLRFSQGRALLARDRWQDARPLFRAAMGSSNRGVALAAVAGFFLSYLHFDLEPFMKLIGRVDQRIDGS